MDARQKMSETKSALQEAFRATWNKAGRRGVAGAATGVGKTKPAIDEMMDLWDAYIFEKEPRYCETGVWIEPKKVLVVVPTEEMRDVNWPAEVEEWYGKSGLLMWKESVTAICYVSLYKYDSNDFDLVILDECHHLTEMGYRFFKSRIDVMALSATYPDPQRDPGKWQMLNRVAPLIFTYSLDQGVDDEIIAPFDIHVVRIPLDNIHKNIEAGPKDKRYMTTEAARYNVLSNVIKKLHAQRNTKGAESMTLARRTFLCNLPSKLEVARKLTSSICDLRGATVTDELKSTDGVRTLVFCGSIKQADTLFGENVYHSKKKAKKGERSALDRFREMELNTLGVVSAVNEGLNIPAVDQAIIIQGDSNARVLTQRIGRIVRWREDHRATIWILVTVDTQDEVWFNNAIKGFDQSKIQYHSHKEFLT